MLIDNFKLSLINLKVLDIDINKMRNTTKSKKIILLNMLFGILSLCSIEIVSFGNQVAFADTLNQFNLTILHTNDVHGRLEPIDYSFDKHSVGGVARRATLIKEIKAHNENVLVLDGGDIAQGTLYFKLYHGIPDMKILSEMGYDAAVLGNHDFDEGISGMQNMVNAASFPVLSANVKFMNNNQASSSIKPYIIKDYQGFKIGIIGITTGELKTLTNLSSGLEVDDNIQTAEQVAKSLKGKVDLIIVLSHSGLQEDIKLAKECHDIDIIVGGHSHTLLNKPLEIYNGSHDTLVLQDGEFGIYLGDLNLSIKNNKISNYNYSSIPVDSKVKSDEKIAAEVSQLSQQIKALSRIIIGNLVTSASVGQTHSSADLTYAGCLINNSVKYLYPNVDIVLQNSGGLRKTINSGNISMADIYEFHPFGNTLYLTEISGKDLKSILETSSRALPHSSSAFLQTNGLEYDVNINATPQLLSKDKSQILKEGNRVSNIKINGEPINFNKFYKVAVSNFIFDGGDGYTQFKNARNTIKTGTSYQDMIVDYIKKNSPISLKIKDKVNMVKY